MRQGLQATHLSSWSLLLGTATVILIGSHYWTPLGGQASLVQSRFEGRLKDKEVCVHACMDFIDDTKLYSGYHVTLVWFMDRQIGTFKEMMHAHMLITHTVSVCIQILSWLVVQFKVGSPHALQSIPAVPLWTVWLSAHMCVCVCGLGVPLFMSF